VNYANDYGTQTASALRPHGHAEFFDLEQADEELQRRVEELETDRDALRHELTNLGETIEEHEGTGDEHAELLEELTERVTWLEGVVANAGLVVVADFDTFTAEDRRLAKLARIGREAQLTLLSENLRTQHNGTIERAARRAAAYEVALATSTAAAIVLGETSPDDPHHTEVLAAYRAARKAQPSALSDHERQRAHQAASELAADDIARQELADVIEAGDAAAHDLLTRARTRVAEAIGHSEMMPPWFASSIGRTVSAQEPDRWIARAAEVLVYRLTYGLTGDQVRALGTKPNPQQDLARYTLYTRLARTVR